MKLQFMNKTWILSLVAAPLLLVSCIKDTYRTDFEDNTQRLITEFAEGRKPIVQVAVDAATGISVVNMAELRAVTRSIVPAGYNVTVTVNNNLITAYNTANGTNFTPAPAAAVTLEGLNFSLSNERRSVNVVGRVNTSLLAGNAYAIGLTISTVSKGAISEVAKDILVAISVKNPWDGDYRATGFRNNHGGPSPSDPIVATFPFDDVKTLYTVNANTCEMLTADAIDYCLITVNPDNSVTMSTSPFGSFVTSNEGNCSYNPATRTFTLNYKYFNSLGNYRYIRETLVRQ
ncbi:MAG: BT_3044 domain-containing protein [Bacteroidota bacterium]|jgi:hypothetical protein